MKILHASVSLLALATVATSTLNARIPGYDRTVARKQMAAILQSAVKQGKISAEVAAHMTSRYNSRNALIDRLADSFQEEGFLLGSPLLGTMGDTLIADLNAKLSDGRGSLEASLTPGGTNGSPGGTRTAAPTVANGSSLLGGRLTAPTLGGTTAPTGPAKNDKSQISEGGVWDWFKSLFTGSGSSGSSGGSGSEGGGASGGGSSGGGNTGGGNTGGGNTGGGDTGGTPAPKPCDEDVDVMCGFRGTTGGGSYGGTPKTPTGEYQRKIDPGSITKEQVDAVLGAKQGNVTNPTPDDGTGSGRAPGATLPTTANGGAVNGGLVVNPGSASTPRVVTTPKSPVGALDPLIKPDPLGNPGGIPGNTTGICPKEPCPGVGQPGTPNG